VKPRLSPHHWAAPLVAIAMLASACSMAGNLLAPTAPGQATRTTRATEPRVGGEASPPPSAAPAKPDGTPAVEQSTEASKPRIPVIVIDPGHSGKYLRHTDSATGLRDIDYPNFPEIYEVFDVSSCVGKALRSDGYRVTLTKSHALSSVSLSRRAQIANRAKADLAISVHDDHSQSVEFEAVYDQRGVRGADGKYPAMYRGVGSHRTVFRHPKVARASQRDAQIIARARAKAQHRPVRLTVNNFDGRAPLEPGNLAIVQLLADVPWVYNEMGAKTGGSLSTAMSIAAETRYAKGLLLGVEATVPLAAGTVAQPSRGAKLLHSCLVRRVEPKSGHYTRPLAYLPYGFRS
jgi:N-acetylmuramoyl-L-alanine amidase